jgi:hypothetical protein
MASGLSTTMRVINVFKNFWFQHFVLSTSGVTYGDMGFKAD